LDFNNYSFDKLPFSDLFTTYLSEFNRLSSFYAVNPFDLDAIRQKAHNFSFPGDKKQAIEQLKAFNEGFELDEAALKNLDRLHEEDALALVTGQQLGIYGGPLYTMFKTISTIHLAGILERELERPVIPVFWLADEDHDYDEIKNVTLLERDEVISFDMDSPAEGTPPVAEMNLPETFKDFRNGVKDALFDTDFSEDLWNLLDACYRPGASIRKSFGDLIGKLFSGHGLVLAGSNDKSIKELSRECIKRSIRQADQIRNVLEEQSSRLEKAFHRQVKLYDSNLFYLDRDNGRTKIVRDGNRWKTNGDIHWDTDQLLEEIDQQPWKFSPNVFLRPVFQDVLIPTLGYVAGPGEVAYYGQMKRMYDLFGLEMPVIFPRMSATLVEPAIDRILGVLPFEIGAYHDRIEDLESRYVEQAEKIDVETIFQDWKEKVKMITERKKEEISEIDPTLEGAAGKATAVYEGELDKLKGKVYRAIKQQEQTQLNRIRKIKANLFPNGELQERAISAIYFMNKYGCDIWDRILSELDEDEQFNRHKLIYL